MKKLIFIILSFITSTYASQLYVLNVPKMHCPLCTAMVRKQILKINGVDSVNMDLNSKTANITSSKKLTIDDFKSVLKIINYDENIVLR